MKKLKILEGVVRLATGFCTGFGVKYGMQHDIPLLTVSCAITLLLAIAVVVYFAIKGTKN